LTEVNQLIYCCKMIRHNIQTWEKFDKINYLKQFKPGIKPTHQLLEYALLKYRVKGTVLDLGGGPAITHEILKKHQKRTKVYNIEPSRHCLAIKSSDYHPLRMSLKQAIKKDKIPKRFDCLVACSSLHEIALSNRRSNSENKRILFAELARVLPGLKPGGLFIVCEVEYRKRATAKQIKQHMWIAQHTFGHDHPREEQLSVVEIKSGLKDLKLVETRRRLQIHNYRSKISKIIWSKLMVFKKC
jgi:ubiquinone/menaquinone biosynthesis C-methylase UbiE